MFHDGNGSGLVVPQLIWFIALARWHQSSALYNYSRKGDFVNDFYAKNYCVNDDTTKKLHSLWLKEKV